MQSHKKYKVILLAAAFCMLMTCRGFSQATDLLSLKEEIQRNEELIKQAEILISKTSSIKARASLETAKHLHQQSRLLAISDRLALAARAVKKTREAVLRAIALAKREAKIEENAKKAIERAVNRLEQAKALLEESSSHNVDSAKKLTEEAQVQLHRSIDNMREHLFSTALHLANSSERLSTKAIKLLKKDILSSNEVESELYKTDQLLDRIDSNEDLVSHPAAERRYREARELQSRAYDQLQAGYQRRAVELTKRARAIALNVAKILSSSSSAETVEEAISLTESLLEQAEEMAREQDYDKTRKKLLTARGLHEDAKSQFSRKNYDRALRLTLRAREMLKEAIGSLEKPLDEEEVEATLRLTDNLIERLKGSVDRSDDSMNHELFTRILSHQESAWMEFNKGKLRAALTRTKLARNLAKRILDRMDEKQI